MGKHEKNQQNDSYFIYEETNYKRKLLFLKININVAFSFISKRRNSCGLYSYLHSFNVVKNVTQFINCLKIPVG